MYTSRSESTFVLNIGSHAACKMETPKSRPSLQITALHNVVTWAAVSLISTYSDEKSSYYIKCLPHLEGLPCLPQTFSWEDALGFWGETALMIKQQVCMSLMPQKSRLKAS